MKWSDLPLNPSDRMLRQFAGLWVAFFGGLAAWRYFGADAPVAAAVLAALAVTVGPLGLLYPRAIRPIFVVWLVLAFPIGWVVSTVLLGLLFYGLFTPLAVLFRLIGRDPLQLRRPPARDSYWAPKAEVADVGRYFQQF